MNNTQKAFNLIMFEKKAYEGREVTEAAKGKDSLAGAKPSGNPKATKIKKVNVGEEAMAPAQGSVKHRVNQVKGVAAKGARLGKAHRVPLALAALGIGGVAAGGAYAASGKNEKKSSITKRADEARQKSFANKLRSLLGGAALGTSIGATGGLLGGGLVSGGNPIGVGGGALLGGLGGLATGGYMGYQEGFGEDEDDKKEPTAWGGVRSMIGGPVVGSVVGGAAGLGAGAVGGQALYSLLRNKAPRSAEAARAVLPAALGSLGYGVGHIAGMPYGAKDVIENTKNAD